MVERSKFAEGITKAPTTFLVARISVFTALSVVGAFIKLPSPLPTIAFDSGPGFFAALYFGALDGTLTTGIGHIVTSIINGFPLGVYHLPIALGMALAGGATGLVNKVNKKWGFIPAAVIGVAINTAFVVVVVPLIGWAAALALVPFLLLAASLNAIIAALIYVGVRARRIRT